jgi:hypothetical protein
MRLASAGLMARLFFMYFLLSINREVNLGVDGGARRQ